jgi:hypothetical protein
MRLTETQKRGILLKYEVYATDACDRCGVLRHAWVDAI